MLSNRTEFISGRSRERAKQLIQLAEDAGLEATVIRTDSIRGGYLVPKKVADAYAGEISGTPADDAGEQGENADITPADGDITPADGDITPADENTDAADPEPAGNASQSVWADWAKRNKNYDESEGLTRDQLKQRFGA